MPTDCSRSRRGAMAIGFSESATASLSRSGFPYAFTRPLSRTNSLPTDQQPNLLVVLWLKAPSGDLQIGIEDYSALVLFAISASVRKILPSRSPHLRRALPCETQHLMYISASPTPKSRPPSAAEYPRYCGYFDQYDSWVLLTDKAYPSRIAYIKPLNEQGSSTLNNCSS